MLLYLYNKLPGISVALQLSEVGLSVAYVKSALLALTAPAVLCSSYLPCDAFISDFFFFCNLFAIFQTEKTQNPLSVRLAFLGIMGPSTR